MEKIIAFSNKTESRDKLTKAIQYLAKIIAWSLIGVDKSLHKKFNELYIMARDSRKIFRLFKSVQELKNINDKIKDLLNKNQKFPIFCDVCSRIGYLVSWIFDNLYILSTVKMIKLKKFNLSESKFYYLAHFGWLIGICCGLLKNFYELSLLVYSSSYTYEDEREEINVQQEFNRKREIIYQLICIVGRLGDLIPSSSGMNLPEKILGYQLNDGIIGLGGLTSALVTMWIQWNQF